VPEEEVVMPLVPDVGQVRYGNGAVIGSYLNV
jgi:hypothetical protein